MPALQATVAFAQVDGSPFAVGEDLKFNMPGIFDEFFDVDGAIAEGAFGLGLGRVKTFDEGRVVMGDAHAAPAAAAGRLDDDRVTDFTGDLERFVFLVNGTVTARHNRDAGFAHRGPGRDFVTHRADGVARRADKFDVAVLADFDEMRVLGQETVAGMDGFHIRNFRGTDDPVDLEIAFRTGRFANADRFIRQLDVERIGVGLGVDGHTADAEFLAGADDAHRNFTPVGNQNFVKHAWPIDW